MATKVVVTVPSPDDILSGYSAGALIRIQQGATDSGSFANLTTIPVVAATYQYESWDATGDGTTWYRWRPENSGGTETGDWSSAFQGIEAAAAARQSGSYASIDDYLLGVGSIPNDSRRLAAIERALVQTAADLGAELGRDAFRHPQSGTETRYYPGDGTGLLHVHEGLVSVTSVSIKFAETDTDWIVLDTDEYWQEGYLGDRQVSSGEPYFHIRLSRLGSYTYFPRGDNLVRVIAAFGWDRPSIRWVEANVAFARQRIAGDLTLPGGQIGPPEWGAAVGPNRLPDAVWRLKLAESRRFTACWT